MDLISTLVTHKAFGTGTVVSVDNAYITIKFGVGEKKFAYPDAFKTFLTSKDPVIAKEINTYIINLEAAAIKEKDIQTDSVSLDSKVNKSKQMQSSRNIPAIKDMINNIPKGKHGQRYFFVFQNKSFDEECRGGYLWAPKANFDGREASHWKLMQEVTVGDVIFHSLNKNIVAISVARSDCYSAMQPEELRKERIWENDGWRVDCKYILMQRPIVTSDYMPTLLKLQPGKYAPFNRLGRGNTGYLFDANLPMAQFLFSTLAKANPYLTEICSKVGLETESI